MFTRKRVVGSLTAVCMACAWIVVFPEAAPAATGNIVEYSIPTANSGPVAIAAGPDGNLWFTETNNIGRITPSGSITEYPVPTSGASPAGIVTGPDGNLWFTEFLANNIGRLTTGGVFTEFPLPNANSGPDAITVGPDNNLWFTEVYGNRIAKMTTLGAVTEYAIATSNSQPSAITTGPDGALWFTENAGLKIGRISTSGVMTEFAVPGGGQPSGITAAPDGNLWYADTGSNKVGKLTTGGTFTEYSLPTSNSFPLEIATGPDGNLWVTEESASANKIARVTLAGVASEYTIPTASSFPIGIATGSDGNVWFTEDNGNKIGRVEVDPALVLPAMANAAYGGYTTVAEIQNIGANPATVVVHYFDSSGRSVGAGDVTVSLPVHATWTVRQDNGHSFTAGNAGSAKVYSLEPLTGFVNEFPPGGTGDATSYTAASPATGSGLTLFAPAIANNAYGGYTTGIGLLNAGSVPTGASVTYRDATGAQVKTQDVGSIAPGAYVALYSGDVALGLPNGFAGTATIQSSASPIAAIVNETGPGGQFSSYDAIPSGSTSLFAPVALNNAYGGYFTGMGIQNTSNTPAVVVISYYNAAGSLASSSTNSIPAFGYAGVYQGTDISTTGAFTATIVSTQALAAIVNEVAPSNTSAKQSTSYNAFSAGATTMNLPLVENGGTDGWSTGEGIMNTGSASTTVAVYYYDPATGSPIGTPDILTLPPNAFWGLYQPNGGLPSGSRASAVIRTFRPTRGGDLQRVQHDELDELRRPVREGARLE